MSNGFRIAVAALLVLSIGLNVLQQQIIFRHKRYEAFECVAPAPYSAAPSIDL